MLVYRTSPVPGPRMSISTPTSAPKPSARGKHRAAQVISSPILKCDAHDSHAASCHDTRSNQLVKAANGKPQDDGGRGGSPVAAMRGGAHTASQAAAATPAK